MLLGILNAIPPEASRVDWEGTPTAAYIRFFESVQAPFDYVGVDVAQGQLPATPEACDAYVITGSPRGVYDGDPWIAALSEFIRDSYQAERKLVGICFGHQILAQALGGRTEKSEKGWGLGLKSIDIASSRPWMGGEAERCSLYYAHQDQVVRLPKEAELLGGNGFCPNALYTIDNRVLGIQGHPEFSVSIMRDLLSKAKEYVPERTYQTALDSVSQGVPDNQVVARWIVNFLTDEAGT